MCVFVCVCVCVCVFVYVFLLAATEDVDLKEGIGNCRVYLKFSLLVLHFALLRVNICFASHILSDFLSKMQFYMLNNLKEQIQWKKMMLCTQGLHFMLIGRYITNVQGIRNTNICTGFHGKIS